MPSNISNFIFNPPEWIESQNSYGAKEFVLHRLEAGPMTAYLTAKIIASGASIPFHAAAIGYHTGLVITRGALSVIPFSELERFVDEGHGNNALHNTALIIQDLVHGTFYLLTLPLGLVSPHAATQCLKHASIYKPQSPLLEAPAPEQPEILPLKLPQKEEEPVSTPQATVDPAPEQPEIPSAPPAPKLNLHAGTTRAKNPLTQSIINRRTYFEPTENPEDSPQQPEGFIEQPEPDARAYHEERSKNGQRHVISASELQSKSQKLKKSEIAKTTAPVETEGLWSSVLKRVPVLEEEKAADANEDDWVN